ncbi:cell envelope biogenesis protein OmpA [Erwinia sp. D4-22]
MKKLILMLACAFSVPVFAQSYTGYPAIPGTAKGYATEVVSFTPGSNLNSTTMDPKRALGEPNLYSKNEAVFALGAGGNVVLKFDPLAIKKSGTPEADFYVYEEGPFESFDAYVSTDGEQWIKATPSFKDINPASPTTATNRGSVIGYDVDVIDSDVSAFSYVKIVDTSMSTYSNPGADIDAVVLTSAQAAGADVLVDTDSRNGIVYDLYQNSSTSAIGVKIIDKDNKVTYIPFSTDGSLDAVALSLQGDFNCDDEKDINVLATRKSDSVQLNIIKQQDGTAIRTIDNSTVK